MTLLAHATRADSGEVAMYAVAVVTAGYLLLAGRQRRGPRAWSTWRTAAFVSGGTLLSVGLLPQLLPFPQGDFRQHMIQHLLIGMFAPLGLVLGAPVTLLLRSVPNRYGRIVSTVLRSRPLHLLANPVTALALNVGGMVLLYVTPLYVATSADPALHRLVHGHFLAAGCLFTWAIAGPDPAPRRPSVPARLVVLGVAIAVHAILAQLMYAGLYVQVPVPPVQRQGGAELMYYGGDIAELLLAFALVTTWRPRRTTSPATIVTRSDAVVNPERDRLA